MATLILPPVREILAVGLDVDGVMRDTGYSAYEVMCKSIIDLGGTVPTFEMFVHGWTTDVVTFYGECDVHCGLEEIYRVYRKYLPDDYDACEPYHDVAVFLNHLGTLGLKVFAVSSHPHLAVVDWFATHNIETHFSHVAGGSKDKVICLTTACSKLEVSSRSVCYVGDWGSDMRAALVAGLIPIGITRGYDSRLALVKSGAEYVVEHLEDLIVAIR